MPQIGPAASPEAIIRVAKRAEELHFDPTFSPDGTSLEGFLKSLEKLKELAEGV